MDPINLTRPIYPIGIQNFSEIRQRHMVYVDKTALIYDLVHFNKYVFLSRPRRFGKSLLLSTLAAYFQGQKDLFERLAISHLEKDWIEYPVIRLDFSRIYFHSPQDLRNQIHLFLSHYEDIFGVHTQEASFGQRLSDILSCAHAQYGKPVVLLIDEYDCPILDVIDSADIESMAQILRDLYSPIKSNDEHIRFVFITGITQFSQFSIFSSFNNLKDISSYARYHALCGITEDEIRTALWTCVEQFAQARGIEPEKAIELLRQHYDGYHFCLPSEGLFNPLSLLMAFDSGEIGSYWFSTGTPLALTKLISKYPVTPAQWIGQWVMKSDFHVPIQQANSPMALLYQSGYLTLKERAATAELYRLDLPNLEVRSGFWNALLPIFLHKQACGEVSPVILGMWSALAREDIDAALARLQTFLATVPYTDNTHYEGHYQSILYIIFSLFGQLTDIEVRTPTGRIDVVVHTAARLFIIETKINGSAAQALAQIRDKRYADRFALMHKPITLVGINFSTDERNITDWVSEQLQPDN